MERKEALFKLRTLSFKYICIYYFFYFFTIIKLSTDHSRIPEILLGYFCPPPAGQVKTNLDFSFSSFMNNLLPAGDIKSKYCEIVKGCTQYISSVDCVLSQYFFF